MAGSSLGLSLDLSLLLLLLLLLAKRLLGVGRDDSCGNTRGGHVRGLSHHAHLRVETAPAIVRVGNDFRLAVNVRKGLANFGPLRLLLLVQRVDSLICRLMFLLRRQIGLLLLSLLLVSRLNMSLRLLAGGSVVCRSGWLAAHERGRLRNLVLQPTDCLLETLRDWHAHAILDLNGPSQELVGAHNWLDGLGAAAARRVD